MKNKNNFKINDKDLGVDHRCFVIAEVGLAHDGSLGMAHSYIDAIGKLGVDAVKFQTHISEHESSNQEKFRVNVFPQDSSRRAYWDRTSFTKDQWLSLKNHADEKGMIFLSSPFSIEAVQLLREIGVNAWKIASGETNNHLLLNEICKKEEPVFLSSGMSYLKELKESLGIIQSSSNPVLLMQCTNRYPCLPEKWGLNMINEYQKLFDIPIGFSDHSGEISSSLAAVTLGAKAIEVHVTWHKESFGPDVKASLTLDQLGEMIKGIRNIEKAIQNPVDKDRVAIEMKDMRQLFTKGLFAASDIPKNSIIDIEHINSRKPCLGIPVQKYKEVLGKKTNREIKKGESLEWEFLS